MNFTPKFVFILVLNTHEIALEEIRKIHHTVETRYNEVLWTEIFCLLSLVRNTKQVKQLI